MPETAFGGDIAHNWELWIGRTTIVDETPTTTWTQIFGFTDLPFPDQVPEDIDATHMQSPGRARETIPGYLPVADWSQEKQLWGDAGDDLLKTLSDLTRAGTREIVQFEFNVDPDGTSYRLTFRGYVNSFIPTGSAGGIAMANVNFKMFNTVTNSRVIP
jgi:hypothetical protein